MYILNFQYLLNRELGSFDGQRSNIERAIVLIHFTFRLTFALVIRVESGSINRLCTCQLRVKFHQKLC